MAGISYASAQVFKEKEGCDWEVNFLDEPFQQRGEPLLPFITAKLKRGVPMHPKNICNEKPEKQKQMSWNHT